jgi:8-oxo-dGTP pyrophosphatase MutT (NUDIX family)
MPQNDRVHPLADVLLSPDEAVRMRVPGKVDAAVLIPWYDDPARGPVLVFTERRHDLRKHAGEISFPGGRRDHGEDLVVTALREAEEEIGLDRSGARIVGALAPVTTMVSGCRVYPFVGVVESLPTWRPQVTEVAAVLELAVGDLVEGRRSRPIRAMPLPTLTFTVDGHVVWGATARMLDQLLKRVGGL